MAVITVVSKETTKQEVVGSARVLEVSNTRNVLGVGPSGAAVEVVRPGGTVANVAWGTTLPPNPSEGEIFILVT
jgi:hypothetical protein